MTYHTSEFLPYNAFHRFDKLEERTKPKPDEPEETYFHILPKVLYPYVSNDPGWTTINPRRDPSLGSNFGNISDKLAAKLDAVSQSFIGKKWGSLKPHSIEKVEMWVMATPQEKPHPVQERTADVILSNRYAVLEDEEAPGDFSPLTVTLKRSKAVRKVKPARLLGLQMAKEKAKKLNVPRPLNEILFDSLPRAEPKSKELMYDPEVKEYPGPTLAELFGEENIHGGMGSLSDYMDRQMIFEANNHELADIGLEDGTIEDPTLRLQILRESELLLSPPREIHRPKPKRKNSF